MRLRIEIAWLTAKDAVRRRVKWPIIHAKREAERSLWLWIYRRTPQWWSHCNERCLHSRAYRWIELRADMSDMDVWLCDSMRRNDPGYTPRYEKRFKQKRAMWGDA